MNFSRVVHQAWKGFVFEHVSKQLYYKTMPANIITDFSKCPGTETRFVPWVVQVLNDNYKLFEIEWPMPYY